MKFGGVYVNGGTNIDLQAGTISGNTAINGGGGVYVENTKVEFGGNAGITISENSATNGGGLYISNTGSQNTTTVDNGKVINNTASRNGGGIYHTGVNGSCTVQGAGQIMNNTALNGGGLYITGGSSLTVNGGHVANNQATFTGDITNQTANLDDSENKGVGGGIYLAKGTTVSSNFTMQGGVGADGKPIPVGIYRNTAKFAADDVFAHKESTVLSLPQVENMDLGDGTLKATGWYEDYAANDTAYEQGLKSNSDILAGTDSVQRYQTAVNAGYTELYKVNDEIAEKRGTYICLTIGRDIVNFGDLTISKNVSGASDQYFVFRIASTQLANQALGPIEMEVAVQGNGEVTIFRLPFGTYTVSEVTDWSWRYNQNGAEILHGVTDDDGQVTFEEADGQSLTALTVNDANKQLKVTITNTKINDNYLDGLDQRKNVQGVGPTETKKTGGVFSSLGKLLTGKEAEG